MESETGTAAVAAPVQTTDALDLRATVVDDLIDVFEIVPASERVRIPVVTDDPRTDRKMILCYEPSDENTIPRYQEMRFGVRGKSRKQLGAAQKSNVLKASEWLARNRNLTVEGVRPPADFATTHRGNWVDFLVSYTEGRKILVACAIKYAAIEQIETGGDGNDDEE